MGRFQVSPAAPHELLSACRLLFADGHAEARRERLLSDAEMSGVFVARDANGKLHAAALVQVLPGALGVAWVPRGDSATAIDAATASACTWLRSRGVKVCQAFALKSEIRDMAPLERCGFHHTTQLVLMRRDFSPFGPSIAEPSQPLSFIADSSPFSPEFKAALLATHRETCDCPELHAPRTPAEILTGFDSSSGNAYLVWRGGECVGVVLVEVEDNADMAELTYLGVVPEARRSGLGGELLKFALTAASRAKVEVMALSVDARNSPAMKLYERHGFVAYDRREVWLASWPT
jgi:ribosomal protein S18 acetylase RimI-like enzyme